MPVKQPIDFDLAMKALEPGGHRVLQQRENKKMPFDKFGQNPKDHIGAPPGRSNKLNFSPPCLAMCGTSLRCTDAGLRLGQAYHIGATFAFTDSTGTYKSEGEFHPALHRETGKLFGAGNTWLMCIRDDQGYSYNKRLFVLFSDENPRFTKFGSSPLDTYFDVGSPSRNDFRMLLNLSDLCRNMARSAQIDFDSAFMPSTKTGKLGGS